MDAILGDTASCSSVSDLCDFLALEVPQTNMTFYAMSLSFYASDYCSFVRWTTEGGESSAEGATFNATHYAQCWKTIAPLSMQ